MRTPRLHPARCLFKVPHPRPLLQAITSKAITPSMRHIRLSGLLMRLDIPTLSPANKPRWALLLNRPLRAARLAPRAAIAPSNSHRATPRPLLFLLPTHSVSKMVFRPSLPSPVPRDGPLTSTAIRSDPMDDLNMPMVLMPIPVRIPAKPAVPSPCPTLCLPTSDKERVRACPVLRALTAR